MNNIIMFTGIIQLYNCTRGRKEDKLKLLVQQDIDRTVMELNLLHDSLLVNYDQAQWNKLNRITELSRKYKNLTGRIYRRKDFYFFTDEDNIEE